MSRGLGAGRSGTRSLEDFRNSSAAKQDDDDCEYDEPVDRAEFSHSNWILVLALVSSKVAPYIKQSGICWREAKSCEVGLSPSH